MIFKAITTRICLYKNLYYADWPHVTACHKKCVSLNKPLIGIIQLMEKT